MFRGMYSLSTDTVLRVPSQLHPTWKTYELTEAPQLQQQGQHNHTISTTTIAIAATTESSSLARRRSSPVLEERPRCAVGIHTVPSVQKAREWVLDRRMYLLPTNESHASFRSCRRAAPSSLPPPPTPSTTNFAPRHSLDGKLGTWVLPSPVHLSNPSRWTLPPARATCGFFASGS